MDADTDDFRYYLRVRYAECDAQKVVFNARYGDYVELAVTEFMRALGFGAELANAEIDYQLVKQTLEWKAPARFDDVLELRVRPLRLGNTSFTMSVGFRRDGDETLLASAETIYVLVDHQLRKRPLPEGFRTALQRGAPGRSMDHAGRR